MNFLTVEYLHWNPVIWVIIFLILIAVSIVIGRLFFRNDYNTINQQSLPFYSGTSNKKLQLISASNLYWGFKHTLEVYFSLLKRIFISDVEDFMQWFIIIVALMFLIITGVL